MTKKEIITELKRLGWKHKRNMWYCPWKKKLFQGVTLSAAASLECLESKELL